MAYGDNESSAEKASGIKKLLCKVYANINLPILHSLSLPPRQPRFFPSPFRPSLPLPLSLSPPFQAPLSAITQYSSIYLIMMKLSISFLLFACFCYASAREIKSSETCEKYSKDKEKCLQTYEEGVPCSYCNSAAVGGLCAPETDTKDLPSSVFACEYQAATNFNSTKYNSMPDTCWTDFDKCLDSCPTPTSGATCDNEISGVNSYWCCHEPSSG